MDPNNNQQGGDLRDQQPRPQSNTDATANLIRTQISALYGDQPVASPQPQPTPQAQPAPVATTPVIAPNTQQRVTYQQQQFEQRQQQAASPYDRTYPTHMQPQADQWKKYHSAWQDYYQKYYAGYYAAQQKKEAEVAAAEKPTVFGSGITTEQPQQPAVEEIDTASMSKDQALFELRQKLLGKVRQQAKKVRKSRHFMPLAAASLVVLLFVFIQYNSFFISAVNAYVSPGAINPQNIIIDPSNDAAVGPEPRLIIPKINVDVPTIYDTTPAHNDQMAAMAKGVAHFAIPGASSKPGEIGNTVFSGHSSNDLFDQGDYKFIFAQLEKLAPGDKIYANYEGRRYTYVVTKTEVVKPTEVSKLIYPTDKPVMTLITCTPLGTALNRLLVTAEQVSPDPSAAKAAPENSGSTSANEAMPGTAPTFLERIFGGR